MKIRLLFLLFFTQYAVGNTYTVSLSDKQGNAIEIGQAEVSNEIVKFEKDHDAFKDFFLSMKEMKCLEGPEIWCHIPYPYEKSKINKENQLPWLSHELLFMYKKHDQFGAQLWQGVFFHLKETESGFESEPYSVDLNELASPPEDLNTPPLRLIDMELLDIEPRWLPILKLTKIEK